MKFLIWKIYAFHITPKQPPISSLSLPQQIRVMISSFTAIKKLDKWRVVKWDFILKFSSLFSQLFPSAEIWYLNSIHFPLNINDFISSSSPWLVKSDTLNRYHDEFSTFFISPAIMSSFLQLLYFPSTWLRTLKWSGSFSILWELFISSYFCSISILICCFPWDSLQHHFIALIMAFYKNMKWRVREKRDLA